ncbi:hypothetical protein GALL_287010 [mine drainage metagenome]|uniref:Uncharacterized protein n=1 Tax=mine drainage metagenome TaxID=410659 RepID=A0A1J5RIH0_9ZZZZ
MRSLSSGWSCRNANTSPLSRRDIDSSRSSMLAIACGGYPDARSTAMPTRSASRSTLRENASVRSIAAAWPPIASPCAALPLPAAPARIASTSEPTEISVSVPACAIFCATWRWVMCDISCANTAASSSTPCASTTVPVCMQMKPPGSAKALKVGSRSTSTTKRRGASGSAVASAAGVSRSTMPCRYSRSNASSR